MLEYLILINTITFLIFGVDKFLAIKRYFRIPESALLGLSLVGGCFGAVFSMLIFRHKTKKRRFQIIIPLTILLWIDIIIGVFLP